MINRLVKPVRGILSFPIGEAMIELAVLKDGLKKGLIALKFY
jgi:hypothetical protein